MPDLLGDEAVFKKVEHSAHAQTVLLLFAGTVAGRIQRIALLEIGQRLHRALHRNGAVKQTAAEICFKGGTVKFDAESGDSLNAAKKVDVDGENKDKDKKKKFWK